MNTRNDEFVQKATSSLNLSNRANINAQYGSNDFDGWVKGLINSVKYNTVLDICCGTGNQLVLYAAKPEVQELIGVDISKKSLVTAEARLKDLGYAGLAELVEADMDKLFGHSSIANKKFDLISCFYGLYYAQNVDLLLENMVSSTSESGAILIVGPYGENNKTLFDLLGRHFKLDEKVVSSCTTFMEENVLPILMNHMKVQKETFRNDIRYPSVQELMKYWQSSTFYMQEHEQAVKKDIEKHFNDNGEFIVTKHIMAYIASKK